MIGKFKIAIQGDLDKNWKRNSEEMEIGYKGDNTLLSENIKDEDYLHGILNQIRDLTLKLISITPV